MSRVSPRERLASVDVFRGVTIAGMLLVNNPGLPNAVYTPLAHSAWNGCTFADLIFPAFLVMVGVTTQLAHARRRATTSSILRRAGWLFLAGVLLNAYPFFENRVTAGPAWLPVPLAHIAARVASLRLMGVLQRIGLVYLAVALLRRSFSTRTLGVLAASILVGYWLLLAFVPVPGVTEASVMLMPPEQTWPVWLDQRLLDWTRFGLGWHLYDRQLAFDPEGVLSTVPAIATALLGVLAGQELLTPRALKGRVVRLAVGGVLLLLMGLVWSVWLPFNKPLWTSSYVLFSAGMAWLSLSVAVWCTDVKSMSAVSTPWLVFGTNPFVMFVGSELLASVLRSSIKWRIDGKLTSTGGTVATLLERIGFAAPAASLAWAFLFTLLCWLLVRPLYRRGKFISI